MYKNKQQNQDRLGKQMIHSCGIELIEAAHIIHELHHCMGADQELDAQNCIRRLREAREILQEMNPCITLEQGVLSLLEGKKHRRSSTRRELKYYTMKILAENPELATREMRHISTRMCGEILEKTFPQKSSRRKARTILHGLFSYCCRRGWIRQNPVHPLQDTPPIEHEIAPLTLDEVACLLKASLLPQHRTCAPAVGIMLWGGIRPAEVARLSWSNIHFRSRTITLYAVQSKTGGSRCVSMHPPLFHWLRRFSSGQDADTPICPRDWIKRWGALHRACGMLPWVPDVLRHTFASYHAAHFRCLDTLQYEMGHRSTQMLRFRYIAASRVSRQSAAAFWSTKYWEKRLS